MNRFHQSLKTIISFLTSHRPLIYIVVFFCSSRGCSKTMNNFKQPLFCRLAVDTSWLCVFYIFVVVAAVLALWKRRQNSNWLCIKDQGRLLYACILVFALNSARHNYCMYSQFEFWRLFHNARTAATSTKIQHTQNQIVKTSCRQNKRGLKLFIVFMLESHLTHRLEIVALFKLYFCPTRSPRQQHHRSHRLRSSHTLHPRPPRPLLRPLSPR